MRIDIQPSNVIAEGLGERKKFGMAVGAMTFRLLSKAIYSMEERAIVRELMANAYDSHVRAGTNHIPVYIHLPTWNEPYFLIRDYGTGLSHEDVLNVYTTYFISTKQDDNDQVGCMGLGSKSPFAKVDQFSFIVRYNGTKRLYLAFLNDDGEPEVVLQHTSDLPVDLPDIIEAYKGNTDGKTTEEIVFEVTHSGIEIKIPVESYDFTRFKTEAEDVLQWYPVRPTVVGDNKLSIPIIDYHLEGTGWKLRNERNYNNSTGSRAIQGHIAYPIDLAALSDLDPALRAVLKLPLDIDFEIGALMPVASREHLSYGRREPTIESIRQKAQQILDELPVFYQDKINACNTEWEARLEFSNIVGTEAIRGLSDLADKGHLALMWRGMSIKSSSIHVPVADFADPSDAPTISISLIKPSYSSKSPERRRLTPDIKGSWVFPPKSITEIFIDDLSRGAIGRIRSYLENINSGEFYLIQGDEREVDRFRKVISGAPIRNVSDLPEIPKAHYTRGKTVRVKQLSYGNLHSSRYRWSTTSLAFDDVDNGIFVAIRRGKVYGGEDFDDEEDWSFSEIVKSAKSLGIINTNIPIYGVSPRDAKRLNTKQNWIALYEYVAKGVMQLARQDISLSAKTMLDDLQRMPRFLKEMTADTWSNIVDRDSLFVTFITSLLEVKKHTSGNDLCHSNIKNLARRLKILNLPLADGLVDLKPTWISVKAVYPMIAMLNSDHFSSWSNVSERAANLDVFIDYINMVNRYLDEE